MAAIEMRNIVKEYGDGFKAVNDVSLDIADGEFMILVGPSGCGKSTLLRMIVGLEDITSGDMVIGGNRVNEKAPRDRNLSMVFQNYALYPHLTVFENIAFPLRLQKGLAEEDIRRRVQDAADMLELNEHLERKPANLSGGQRQRVAMGRAIVREVNAFLFDEPLSNLDAKLRGQMRTEISRMQRRLGTTTVYVTHDQTEAMTLGDRVAVLRRGFLQQVASPRELYEQPVNMFVAGFIGSPPMNFLPAVVAGDRLKLPFLEIDVPAAAAGRVTDGQLLLAGLRPDHFEDAGLLDDVKRQRGALFRARVDVTEWLGDAQYAYIPFEAGDEVTKQLAELAAELDSEALRTQLVVKIDAMSRLRENQEAQFWADTRRMHLFDPRTGENITRDESAAAELAQLEQEKLQERMA
ncbi:putative sugar ABC transporter, ATP-binding protein SugC [Actinoplanes italicus]|uniref:Carbohydrate ABC transporter ATP-binding protein (CUT1 family) n=1 Tax=Actinoplanes italicus TaxID=113567 RepID=A0A2T0K8R1_9ACTN|nr:sn-glycerol-3-phosphate ABC transporter ATP-binding protein UgpC [Actinoplanes italicus]PRX19465.1 carbohydrate ABC transporter ATP-binding protein (CUT1 family) [Actinoplanes italicus]GIE30520.1 putative sugar ABC transporter, ATP-binding protein SugC [Actinoplanes italicus]